MSVPPRRWLLPKQVGGQAVVSPHASCFFSDVGNDPVLPALRDAGIQVTEVSGPVGPGHYDEVSKLIREICPLVVLSLHAFSGDVRAGVATFTSEIARVSRHVASRGGSTVLIIQPGSGWLR